MAKCAADEACVSAELKGWAGEGDTAKLDKCQLSSTCTEEKMQSDRDTSKGWTAWVKDSIDGRVGPCSLQ